MAFLFSGLHADAVLMLGFERNVPVEGLRFELA